jgi:hypothetical protein
LGFALTVALAERLALRADWIRVVASGWLSGPDLTRLASSSPDQGDAAASPTGSNQTKRAAMKVARPSVEITKRSEQDCGARWRQPWVLMWQQQKGRR